MAHPSPPVGLASLPGRAVSDDANGDRKSHQIRQWYKTEMICPYRSLNALSKRHRVHHQQSLRGTAWYAARPRLSPAIFDAFRHLGGFSVAVLLDRSGSHPLALPAGWPHTPSK